jgi:phosphoenolpyruvate carboxylase
MMGTLMSIREMLETEHHGLFLDMMDEMIGKVKLFGYHFASLDIRQNSRIHDKALASLAATNLFGLPNNYFELVDDDRMSVLTKMPVVTDPRDLPDDARDIVESIRAMRMIQLRNGEQGCNRYIISNAESQWHVLEVLALFELSGWSRPTVDIVPLFEAVEDLKHAAQIMEALYTNNWYRQHLDRRGKQTVMLGFSDGTKDGGYLKANWGIYEAKEEITRISRKYDVNVVFFDGRGGPPERGGGKTHQFYASLGREIENSEIQVTVQGQTISSNFGTHDACRFNVENLLTAGFRSYDRGKHNELSPRVRQTINGLADVAYRAYSDFKDHPKFVDYLEKRSTLNYYSQMNIGSRPAKRNKGGGLVFEDLRAIPFVVSWAQLKQNVPGFYGVGTALRHFEDSGRWDELKQAYDESLFLRALMDNSMMSLAKSFFPLTEYMKNDPEFGEFWTLLYEEYQLSIDMLFKLSGQSTLMQNYPDSQASIAIREQIVRPLLVIQQYALISLNSGELSTEEKPIFEKLIIRSLYGNTNASRNSA